MSEWRPIETAPKDGEWILVWCVSVATGEYAAVVYWDYVDELWHSREVFDGVKSVDDIFSDDDLSHWMPIKEPPR